MKKIGVLIFIGSMFAVLSACVSGANTESALSPTRTATLLPPYLSTSQSAAADAQSTSLAVNSILDSLKPTQTFLAMISTQSEATKLSAANETATAQSYQKTQIAETQVQQTADASNTQTAYENDVHATETQFYLNELARQDQQAQNVASFNTWSWRAALVVIYAFGLGIVSIAVFVGWQNRLWLLTRLGIIRWGADGKPYWTMPASNGGIVIVDPSRSFAPGIVIQPHGSLETAGAAEPEFQDRTNARAQAADLLLAAGPAPSIVDHRIAVRQAAQIAAPTPVPGLPASSTPELPEIEIVDAEEVKDWLEEVSQKLLTEGDEL